MKQYNPLLTVLIPVYKPDLVQLNKSLKSIIDQTYKNYECLILYDSPDIQTSRELEGLSLRDSRFKVISCDGNGLAAALNKGITLSEGELIVRMDADDISLPNRFEDQVRYIYNVGCDIVGGHYQIIDNSGADKGSRVVPCGDSEILFTLAKTVPFAHSSVMLKKSFLMLNNLSYTIGKDCISEDYDLWIRMYDCGAKFGNVDAWVLKYRLSDTSLNKRVLRRSLAHSKALRHKFIFNHKNKLLADLKEIDLKKISGEQLKVITYLTFVLAIEYSHFALFLNLVKNNPRYLIVGCLKYLNEKFFH